MKEPEMVPLSQIKTDDLARDLMARRPEYVEYITARMQGQDGESELEIIRALPLEERYTWRIASALRWAFADFEPMNIAADLETLSEEDLKRLVDLALVQHRAIQLCGYVKSLIGYEEMVKLMVGSIKTAKHV